MDCLFIEINAVWKWLGSATLTGGVLVLVWLMWDIVREEIIWWRKNREYRNYFESGKGRK